MVDVRFSTSLMIGLSDNNVAGVLKLDGIWGGVPRLCCHPPFRHRRTIRNRNSESVSGSRAVGCGMCGISVQESVLQVVSAKK